MSTVWRADHLSLRCPIALKLIDPVVALDPVALQRFLREARTAAALRSPHVVQILDYGVDGETPYIAMEMLEGESLAQRRLRAGRLTFHETARVVRHVARALRRAHEAGIVHRDLKPENIFVVENEDEAIIKVLDFGIAKTKARSFDTRAPSIATQAGTLMGTPWFMSPEQLEAHTTIDFRADLWALGVVAFECLLGELPFKGDGLARLILAICKDPLPIPSQVGTVPQGFDAWFARACARDPRARFASAMEAADEFEQIDRGAGSAPSSSRVSRGVARSEAASARGETSPAPLPPSDNAPATGASRRAQRRRTTFSAIAGALILAGGLASVERLREPAAIRPASAARPEPQLPVAERARGAALEQDSAATTVARSLQSEVLQSSRAAPASDPALPPEPAEVAPNPSADGDDEATASGVEQAPKTRKTAKQRDARPERGAAYPRPTPHKAPPVDLGF